MRRLKKTYKNKWLSLVLLPFFLFLSGFKVVDDLVKEMNTAYQNNQKKSDVSQVVGKYIPEGMELSKALDFLSGQNFEITEFKNEGFRVWPDGELWMYQDEAHRKSALSGSRVVYSAKKSYDRYLIFLLQGKRAVVTIRSDGEKVLQAQGFIHVEGI